MDVAAGLAHPSAGYPVLVAILQVPVLPRLLVHPPPIDQSNGLVDTKACSEKEFRISVYFETFAALFGSDVLVEETQILCRQFFCPGKSLTVSIPGTFLIQCVVVAVACSDLTASGGGDVDGGAAHLLDPLALDLHLLRKDQLCPVVAIPLICNISQISFNKRMIMSDTSWRRSQCSNCCCHSPVCSGLMRQKRKLNRPISLPPH